jgi:predicted Zn-dependent peptidase
MLIGQTAVARNSPDYYALQVLNSILGAGTTSRLSENLRGDKGYTYGVRSAFDFRKGAGPFTVSANVQTAVVKEALVESLKELNGIRGTIQVTQKELDENKQYLIRRYPGQFETAQQISDQLADLAQYGLPDASINDYIVNIQRVTVADVARVATQYLHPDQMAIVIVGDRSGTESKLKELNMPISYLDSRGNTTK